MIGGCFFEIVVVEKLKAEIPQRNYLTEVFCERWLVGAKDSVWEATSIRKHNIVL